MDCSMPGFLVHHQLPELAQNQVHQVGNTIQPSHPLCLLLLLPSIFPIIRVFTIESVLRIRWPKYGSFSFSISPSNEYSGLISFTIDWFDLLEVQKRCPFHYRGLECKSRKSRDTWSNKQIWPWSTKLSRAKFCLWQTVLPTECTGHSK